MAELSLEQQRAMALARARLRTAETAPVLSTPAKEMPVGEARNLSPAETLRAGVRESVTDQPGIIQFLTEMAPATAGGAVGAAAGSLLGPAGTVAGGMAGGLLGEWLAQKTGAAPESTASLVLTGAAPLAGVAGGQALKLGRRAVGKGIEAIPSARTAVANVAQREATPELESLGGKILSKQTGLMSRPQSELWEIARREGLDLSPQQIEGTLAAIAELSEDAMKYSYFPEGQQLLKLIDDTMATLGQGNVSFDTFITTKQLIGSAISRAERAGGIKLGTQKQLFKAMAGDLDNVANSPALNAGQARIAKIASERSKLEFSVRDIEAAVAKLTRDLGDDVAAVDVVALQKWFRDITNPKSAKFDKNFTDSLKGEIPAIKRRLGEIVKETLDAGNPAGRGSLVIRGLTSGVGRSVGTVVGAGLGFGVGGPIGGGIGAMVGASGPEMLTATLMSPRASAMLKRGINLGKGELPVEQWVNIGQVLSRSTIAAENIQTDPGIR